MKVQNKIMEVWQGLPPWAKGVVAIGGIAIGYFGVTSFIGKLKADAALADARATQQNQEKELEDLQNQGVKPSFPTSQYKQWADELQNQFDGCDSGGLRIPVDPRYFGGIFWSNSGAKIANILLQFKNDADFLALSTAWGASRTYDQCGPSWATGSFTGNLSQSVTDELDTREIIALNEYLATKKISYRF
jgi:hypothetical protein